MSAGMVQKNTNWNNIKLVGEGAKSPNNVERFLRNFATKFSKRSKMHKIHPNAVYFAKLIPVNAQCEYPG